MHVKISIKVVRGGGELSRIIIPTTLSVMRIEAQGCKKGVRNGDSGEKNTDVISKRVH